MPETEAEALMSGFLLNVRRRSAAAGAVAVLGLLAGFGYSALSPPLLSSQVLVAVQAAKAGIGVQALIARSDPVLTAAGQQDPVMSLEQLRHQVTVDAETPTLLSITVAGETAADAQGVAGAVADSYVRFVGSRNSPGGQVLARVLGAATPATGVSLRVRAAETAGLGALAGALLGVIVAVVIGRTERRGPRPAPA